MSQDAQSLIQTFEQAKQGQVFEYFDQLDQAGKDKLLAQAAAIDLAEVDRLNRELVQGGQDAASVDLSGLEPASYEPLPANGGDASLWAEAKALGEDALRAGRVAAFVVAGGQGTRLGYDGPKGTFPTSPVRQASLFQIFAEKIRYFSERYGKPIPWFIMTSVINHEATEAFFKENDYFGLNSSDVFFFKQGLMPAVNPEGRIMLEAMDSIALSPDGHGGSLRALVRSGAVAEMEKRGIDIISYFQVDNPLVRCIDPEFIGFHVKTGSKMSSKMLPKAYPEEKVGHFCYQNDRTVVIEYSDMPASMQEETDSEGNLRYLAGSIAIHILDREFVRRMGEGKDESTRLPFHRADKKIKTLDSQGCPYTPEEPNGIKFEMFVFDALPFAENPVIIETAREDDFSPVKNAEGKDSPKTCREDQLRQYARWLHAAGVSITTDDTGLPAISFEVSPLFAVDEASFVESWNALAEKPAITEGTVLK